MVVGKVISKIIQSMPTWEVTKYYGRVCIFQLKCLKYRMQTSEAWFNFKCKFMPGSLRDEAECEELPPEDTHKPLTDKSGKPGPNETQKQGTSKNPDYEPAKKTRSRTKMKTAIESLYKDQYQSRSLNKKQQTTSGRDRSTGSDDCIYKGCNRSDQSRECRTAECKPSSRQKQKREERSSCNRQQGQQEMQQEGRVICTQPRQEEQYSKSKKLKRSKKTSDTPEKKQKLNRN